MDDQEIEKVLAEESVYSKGPLSDGGGDISGNSVQAPKKEDTAEVLFGPPRWEVTTEKKHQ